MMRVTFIAAIGAGLAGLAAPATAQIHSFSRGNVDTRVAADRCSAAVQHQLGNRQGVRGFGGQHVYGRVLNIIQVDPRRRFVRVRGLAASDRVAFGPYNYGAYGAVGYAQANQIADISFRCDVDYRGRVLDVDLNRRR